MEYQKIALFAVVLVAGIVATAAFINAQTSPANGALGMHSPGTGGSSMRDMHNAMHGTNLSQQEFDAFHEKMQGMMNSTGMGSGSMLAMHNAMHGANLSEEEFEKSHAGMPCGGGQGSEGMNEHHQSMHGNGVGMGGMMG